MYALAFAIGVFGTRIEFQDSVSLIEASGRLQRWGGGAEAVNG